MESDKEMLKNYFVILFAGFFIQATSGQSANIQAYHPSAPAEKDIRRLITQAGKEKKNILIVAGGNWCSWCMEFERFRKADHEVDSLIRSDYLLYHLNYSPENENKTVFSKFGYPQRLGFPVILILDEKGKLIHTQKTEYLEQGKSYNRRRLIDFLMSWNRAALDPATY